MDAARPDRLTVAAFVLLVGIGGLNGVAVRFSNLELPPFWGAAARFGAAALLFALAMLALRLPRPRGRALLGMVLFGALNFAAAYAFAYWALVFVKAGLAQVVIATVPLLTLLFAVAQRVEAFRWRALLGAGIAAAGIGVVFREQLVSDAPLFPLLALLAAAACIAEAGVLVKRFPRAHPVTTNAVAMGLGAGLLLGLSSLAREPHLLPAATATWTAFGYLVVMGSGVVFLLYLFVLNRWTASAASYQFLLFPLVTLTASSWLDGERLTASLALGGALVVVGVYVGAFGPRNAAVPNVAPGAAPPAVNSAPSEVVEESE